MTQEKLQELCRYWQKQLRLQDWTVTVRLRRHYDMKPDTNGRACIVLPNKSVLIDILDPNDMVATYPPYDLEKTLIHELAHIHIEPFCPKEDTLEHDMMEQAIECFSDALVRLNRGERN